MNVSRQVRHVRRHARRTSHQVQRWSRRHARQGRHAYYRARREVRPLWREVEAYPRQGLAVARDWLDDATRDLRRGDLRAVALFLLLVTFALLPLQNLRATSGVAAADLVLGLAAVAALVSRHARPAARPLPHLLRNGLGLMVLGGAVGLVFADERMASLRLLARLAIVVALAFVAVVRVAPSGREVRRLLIAFVVIGAVSGALSSLGDVTGLPLLDRSTFGDRAVGLTVLRYPVLDYLRGTTGSSVSIAINPNLFGGVSAVGGAIALILLIEATTWRTRTVLALSFGGLALGVLFSGSRSALLALLVGCLPAVWRLVRRGFGRRVMIGAAAIAALIAVAALTTVQAPSLDRLLMRPGSADAERTAESTILRYQNATRGLEERGWHSLGTGSGLRDDAASALHDGHLEIWVGLGLIGLVGWILLCTGTIESGVRYAGRAGPLTQRQIALLAVGAGFAANVAVTLFVDTIWNRYIWLLVALVVTLAIRPHGVDAPARDGLVGESDARTDRGADSLDDAEPVTVAVRRSRPGASIST
ncbi:MAG TPA: hypothetical protein PKA98_12175 [Acidimicrobiales bacterium]|nr:hypothetical protein [Acidimicrobiales bacterium]